MARLCGIAAGIRQGQASARPSGWRVSPHASMKRARGGSPPAFRPAAASGKENRIGKSMDSLDSLLGLDESSQDEDSGLRSSRPLRMSPRQTAAPRQTSLTADGNEGGRFISGGLFRSDVRVGQKTKLGGEVVVPKVIPYFSFLAYYLQLLVYGAWLEADIFDGVGEAEDFAYSLANDHGEVLAGEVWRLLSGVFVTTDALPLFVTLLAMGTLAAEMEAVMGYGPFLAVYLLSAITGSFIEVVAQDMPTTWGAFPALSGLVGAYLANLYKNRDLQLKIEQASSDDASSSSSGQPTTTTTVAMLSPPAAEGMEGQEVLQSRDERRESSQAASSSGGTGHHHVEAEVEILEWFKIKAKVTRKQRSMITVAAAAVAGFNALVDVMDLDGHSTVAGLLGGLAAGLFLGFTMAPHYDVRREVDMPEGSMSVPERVQEVVVVIDTTPWTQRVGVAAIYSVALAVAVNSLVVVVPSAN